MPLLTLDQSAFAPQVTWDAFEPLVKPDLPGCPWASITEMLAWAANAFCVRSNVWRGEPPDILTVPGLCDYAPQLPGLLEHVWHIGVVGGCRELERVNTQFVQALRNHLPEPVNQITAQNNADGASSTATAVFAYPPALAVGDTLWINGDTSNQYNGGATVTAVNGVWVSWLLPGMINLSPASGFGLSATASQHCGRPRAFAQVNDSAIRLYPTPDAVYRVKLSACFKPGRNAAGLDGFLFDNYAEVIASGAIYRLAAKPGKSWSSSELAIYHQNLFETGIDRALRRDVQSAPVRSRPRMF